jgi:site-specific DNA-methyltransferase (adenine-specific)|tara:strand:+ start:4064 stop:4570 length:507 start_codon:yes stop_codon:yes gene_type:complete
MKIEKIKLEELKLAEYNPRKMSDKQYKDLKASLEKFGLVDPIIINSDNTVVGGHQRLRIMRELGAEYVPTVRVNLSKQDEMELNIRLNKNSGEFDLDVLANNFEVDELKDWGFKDIELGFNIDKLPNDLSDKLELQYKIEVDVTSEKEQEKLYNDLTNKGYTCRILTL